VYPPSLRVILLVKRRVFERAAKMVIRIGPNRGWKLEACAKLKYVFPNQICTINQAIELKVQCSWATGLPSAKRVGSGIHKNRSNCLGLPRVHNVNSRPEKQMAAIATKKTNWEIMARNDLENAGVSPGLSWEVKKATCLQDDHMI